MRNFTALPPIDGLPAVVLSALAGLTTKSARRISVMVANTRCSGNCGLVGKLANAGKKVLSAGLVGGALMLPYAMSNEAKADVIQVVNRVDENSIYAPYFSSYAGVVDANHPGTTIGYDDGTDILLDTSNNPNDWATVTYSTLDGHDVDYNFAPKPTLTDFYTFRLSVENPGTDIVNIPNYLSLIDFTIDNPNGITDYGYTLSVNTDGLGSEYDYTTSGLVSDVFASSDKKFGEWEQDMPRAMDWRNGQSYGEIIFTPIPEPSTLLLLAGAGLAGAGYLATRRLTRSQRRRRGGSSGATAERWATSPSPMAPG